MQPIINYFKNPVGFCDSLVRSCGQWLPDSIYIKLQYRLHTGERLNLKNPQTFQEKLQWLKLYNQNPDYTMMVDKILVKDYVMGKIGKQYVIPLISVWNRPEDIEWDKLPNRFVLKTNHSGGNLGVVVCKDKTTIDRDKAINKLKASLRNDDVYHDHREWPYKNVIKKVFAEEYIEPSNGAEDLSDYKWYCFDGEPKYCQVIQDRNTCETIDFFDIEWNHQEFVGLNPKAENAKVAPIRPANLETQIYIARELSKNIPFSRVDLYEVDGNVFFGEFTFYPASGFGSFRPRQYNEILGQMITMPEK